MLARLRLQDFRCFAALECDLADGVTLIHGANAQGKTSILEAVCVLMRLQSPRARGRGDLIRFGAPRFGVSGECGEIRLRHISSSSRRDLAVDGERCRSAGDYLRRSGLIVWMGNEDLELVRGSGESRRRYLDFAAAQIFSDYRSALRRFDRALRSRNVLLRQPTPNPGAIDAYSTELATSGEIVIARRRELVTLLAKPAAASHADIGGAGETLAIKYAPSVDNSLADALAQSLCADRRRGMTLVGPHRDDVFVSLNGRPASQFGSEGQQRTIALALKLAQAQALRQVRSLPPILLLDDIFGELDPDRRNALLASLPQESQKIITSTHLDWVDATRIHPGRRYLLRAGTLTSE